MTTSQRTPFLAEVLESSPIPEAHLEYFRTRLKMRLYSMIQNVFRTLQAERGFSKTDLAKRLDKDPALISRWMNSPGNLEVNTISDLLLAMKREPILGDQDLEEGAIPPTQEAWLHRTRAIRPVENEIKDSATFYAVNANRLLPNVSQIGKAKPQKTAIGAIKPTDANKPKERDSVSAFTMPKTSLEEQKVPEEMLPYYGMSQESPREAA